MVSSRTTIRLLVLMLAVPSAAAQEPARQVQPPLPQASEPAVDDVVVVTASRREEQLLNAPATMSVLTEEVIGAGPAQNVTDLLRTVPGLNTVQTSARDVNVNIRAATGTLADAMLVLLDGRSIYQDLFGFVLWDFLPVDLSEIKQVEIIRGPASAVWGANAMAGVVNVITKTPREMQGTSVTIRYGQFDRSPAGGRSDGGGLFSINAIHAQAPNDRFAYKISAGVLAQEPLLRPTGLIPDTGTPYPAFANQGTTQPRLDARVDYDLEDGRQKLILAGGISGTEGILHTGLGPLDIQRGSTFKYGRMTYMRGKLKLQAFVNALDGEAPPLLLHGPGGALLDSMFENQVYDVEFSNVHVARGRHLLSYGGNYRHNNFHLLFAASHSSRDEGGAYAQDEIFLSDHYRWIVGARVDGFDVLQRAVLSPRTTFLIKPRASQTIRMSFNRAFRAPSFVNSYLDISFVNQLDLGPAGPFQFPISAAGNGHLKEERLTTYEVGYSGKFSRTTLGAALYLNYTRNMIQFAQAGSYTSAAPPPAWPLAPAVLDQLNSAGRGLPSQFTYLNFNLVADHGAELSAEVRVTTLASVFANYSWQAHPTATGFDSSELNLPPTHRFNAGVTGARGRYFGSLSGSFVDGAFWQDVLPAHQGHTGAYTLVDGAFGVHLAHRLMTVAVRGNNLLNKPIQQHVFGDVIRRTVTGEVRFEF